MQHINCVICLAFFVLFASCQLQLPQTTVKVNEVYKSNGEFWVELYNPRDFAVDMEGYYLKFLPKIPFQFLERIEVHRNQTTFIPAHGFLVISMQLKATQEITHILLVDPSQEKTLDTFSFGAARGIGSYCRFPDAGLWREILDPSPTPGKPNKITKIPKSLRKLSPDGGAFEIHILNVGQGDSQLIVFPSGFTILIDVFESNWNSNNGAEYVADRIREITGRSYVDVGVISHLHMDHLGYAGYGGFWYLIEGEGISFGKIIDRDAGRWVDYDNDGVCNPDTEIEWNVVGTYSGTATNWLCYATNPENEKIFGIREVAELCSTTQIQPSDEGSFVQIITVDGQGAFMEDGKTPVTGNYSSWSVPPSENDFSIGLLIGFHEFRYVTMGDLDGDYDESSYGYTYNDVESIVAPRIGEVDVYHVNHHGSSHSSSPGLLASMKPSVSLISCGVDNDYGHPDQDVLDNLLSYGEVFLTSDCDTTRNYYSAERLNKDIVLYTMNGIDYYVQGNEVDVHFTSKNNADGVYCRL